MDSEQRIVDIVFRGVNKASGVLDEIDKSAGQVEKTNESLFDRVALFTAKFSLISQAYSTIKDFLRGGFDAAVGMEKATIGMAAQMAALGAAATFADGIKMAKTDMVTLEKMAAKLPGEASDYQQVLQMNMNEMLGAGMKHDKAMMELVGNYTAVGMSLGIAKDQLSRDMGRIIQGSVGMDNITWQAMKPYLGKDASKWKSMSQIKRVESLESNLGTGPNGKFKDAIAAFGNTFEAAQGTISSFSDVLQRTLATPVFTMVEKNTVAFANAISDPKLYSGVMRFADLAGTGLAKSMDSLWKGLAPLSGIDLGDMFAKMWGFGAPLSDLFDSLSGTLKLTSTAFAHTFDAAFKLSAGIMSFVSSALPGLVDGVNSLIEPLDQAWNATMDVVGVLADDLYPIVTLAGSALGEFGSALGWVSKQLLGPVADAFSTVSEWAKHLPGFGGDKGGGGIVANFEKNVEAAKENWATMMRAGLSTGDAFDVITRHVFDGADALENINRLYPKLQTYLQQELIDKGEASIHMMHLNQVSNDLQLKFMSLAGVTESATDKLVTLGQQADIFGWRGKDTGTDFLGSNFGLAVKDALAKNVTGKTGKTDIKQDFRGSTFNIKNQFAEGFDPDRIAVAMASQFSRVGEQKLSSVGSGPLFGS